MSRKSGAASGGEDRGSQQQPRERARKRIEDLRARIKRAKQEADSRPYYHVGLLPCGHSKPSHGSPGEPVFPGFAFHLSDVTLSTESVWHAVDGKNDRPYPGGIVRLSPERAEAIKQDLEGYVVVRNGDRGARIYPFAEVPEWALRNKHEDALVPLVECAFVQKIEKPADVLNRTPVSIAAEAEVGG